MKKFSIILLLGLIACGSASKIKNSTTTLPAPVAGSGTRDQVSGIKNGEFPGVTTEKQAYKIYIRSCTSCHALKDPAKYTAEQWEPILPKMFVKAKLTSSEHEMAAIRDYVMARAK